MSPIFGKNLGINLASVFEYVSSFFQFLENMQQVSFFTNPSPPIPIGNDR